MTNPVVLVYDKYIRQKKLIFWPQQLQVLVF